MNFMLFFKIKVVFFGSKKHVYITALHYGDIIDVISVDLAEFWMFS